MRGEQSLVDSRLVMHPVEVRDGDEFYEVAVTGRVLREESEMIGGVALIVGPVFDGTGRHVGFAADDRLDPGVLRRLIKLDRAVEISVIGNGHRRHPKFPRFFHQLVHPDGTVEK